MLTKVVCRLLDAENRMLGFVIHFAHVRGDGHLRARGAVVVPITQSGVPDMVSMHWTDVNIEVCLPWTHGPVVVGGSALIFGDADAMIQVGPMARSLPQIPVGSVAIAIPAAVVGSRG